MAESSRDSGGGAVAPGQTQRMLSPRWNGGTAAVDQGNDAADSALPTPQKSNRPLPPLDDDDGGLGPRENRLWRTVGGKENNNRDEILPFRRGVLACSSSSNGCDCVTSSNSRVITTFLPATLLLAAPFTNTENNHHSDNTDNAWEEELVGGSQKNHGDNDTMEKLMIATHRGGGGLDATDNGSAASSDEEVEWMDPWRRRAQLEERGGNEKEQNTTDVCEEQSKGLLSLLSFSETDDCDGDDDTATTDRNDRTAARRRRTDAVLALKRIKSPCLLDGSRSSMSSEEVEWIDPGQQWNGESVEKGRDEVDRIVEYGKENSKVHMSLLSFSDDDGDDTDRNDSSSSEEAEWVDPLCAPDSDGVIIDELVQRTRAIEILSSDDEEATVPDAYRGQTAPPSRPPPTHSKPRAKSKTTASSFHKIRDELSQHLFKVFDSAAFEGRLQQTTVAGGEPVVAVAWSAKLRTTAGLTRLKRCMRLPTLSAPRGLVGGGGNEPHYYDRTAAIDGNTESHYYDRIAAIELSTKVLDDEGRLRSTLLHEMCHAAAWVLDGTAKPAHGACFKQWAARATAALPDLTVTTTHAYRIAYRHQWACTTEGCAFVVGRHSRSVDVNKHACGRCRGRLREVGGGGARRKAAAATPSAYNLFVQEHSRPVRERLVAASGGKSVPQSLVMQECAQLWRRQKQQNGGDIALVEKKG